MATARCTWTEVSGVDGYNVYLKSNGSFVKQNSELITETVYDIENLEDGNYEAYATSVLNSVESDASNVKGFEIGTATSTPVVESLSTFEPGDFTDTYTVDKPVGTQEGDLLFLSISGRLGGSTADSFLLPDGWVEVANIVTGVGSGNTISSTAYKVAGASEPPSYTFHPHLGADETPVGIRGSAGILRISGADTSNPVVANSSNTGTGGDVIAFAITAVEFTLLIFSAGSSGASTTPSVTNPSGMTSAWFLTNGTSSSFRHGFRVSHEDVGSGDSGTRTAEHNGANFTASLIGIRPA